MPTKEALTLSLIIPVYNEEAVLAATLDAIAAQTVVPDEVIVVNNNSTDQSVGIAKQYKFVKIVHETKQGQAASRNAGFNAATGDILGRINADVKLLPDWTERVKENFASKEIDALAGSGLAALLPRLRHPQTSVWVRLYYFWMRGIFRTSILWGANMAIRRSSWHKIRGKVINDDSLVHEDQDIGLCVLEAGGVIGRDNKVLMTTGEQTYHYFPKLVYYTLRTYKTKHIHAKRPEFQALKRSPPLPVLTILWIFPGMILLPIFWGMSLLFWPIDYLMKWIVRDRNWLS